MGFGLIIQRRSQVPSGGWPECSGMGGRNESECPAGMDRNGWPESAGISGRNGPEYAGGGLIRSKGGVAATMGLGRKGEKELSDERILGDGEFVASILKKAESEPAINLSLEEVTKRVRENTGVGAEEIFSKSQMRLVVKARALYCYLAKERAGMSGAKLMKQLRLTSGAISHLVNKGRELENRKL
jgi:putative transposase